MQQSSNTSLKREQYLTELKNGQWNNKPLIVINPFKVKEAFNLVLKFSLIAFLSVLVWLWSENIYKNQFVPSVQSFQNDLYKTEMTNLANQGKPAAIIWVAENYPSAETDSQLNHLIKNKNADAMMLKAKQLYLSGQPVAAEAMIKLAAEQGHPEAIKNLVKKPELQQDAFLSSLSTIVKDYL